MLSAQREDDRNHHVSNLSDRLPTSLAVISRRRLLFDAVAISKHLSGIHELDGVILDVIDCLGVVPFEVAIDESARSIVLVTSSHRNFYASAVQTRSSMHSQLPCMIFSMSGSL